MSKHTILALSLLFCILSPNNSNAEELDVSSQAALRKTQEVLKNRSKRNKAIGESVRAQKAHGTALNTVGAENVDELYAISSEVMAEIVKETGGDVTKMNELLLKASKDPAAFLRALSPSTRRAIQKLGVKSQKRSLTH